MKWWQIALMIVGGWTLALTLLLATLAFCRRGAERYDVAAAEAVALALRRRFAQVAADETIRRGELSDRKVHNVHRHRRRA